MSYMFFRFFYKMTWIPRYCSIKNSLRLRKKVRKKKLLKHQLSLLLNIPRLEISTFRNSPFNIKESFAPRFIFYFFKKIFMMNGNLRREDFIIFFLKKSTQHELNYPDWTLCRTSICPLSHTRWTNFAKNEKKNDAGESFLFCNFAVISWNVRFNKYESVADCRGWKR